MILEPRPDKFETICGLILSIFASFLAIVQIVDDNYGAEELKAVNEKSQSYQWHQSKGIKQNLVEGQIGLIEALMQSKSIAAKDTQALSENISSLKKKVHKYEKEKDEILKGSAEVGKENWIQPIDNELGKVIGAKEWEHKIEFYNNKGDHMAITSMLIQISIVMGGLALILQEKKLKLSFFYLMIGLGISGTAFGLLSFLGLF
jgi:Domain of unknown function (DUF4337)